MRKQRYREYFFAYYGLGPYACHFCGDPVGFEAVVIHHLDENRENNHIENLAPSHSPCHRSHHHKGKIVSQETRFKLSPRTRKYTLRDVSRIAGCSPATVGRVLGGWSGQISHDMRTRVLDAVEYLEGQHA